MPFWLIMRSVCLRARQFVVTLILSLSFCLMSSAKTVKNEVYELNIPSQEIELALSLLAERTSALLLFPYETVQLEKSNPVVGKCTLDQALSIMLQGTSLKGDLTESGVITISQNNLKVDGSEMIKNPTTKFSKKLTAANVLSVCSAGNLVAQESVEDEGVEAVSYTHLTLPTIYSV